MSEKIFVVIERKDQMFFEVWDKPDKPLMRCGHTANATTTLKPSNVTIHCCVICAGINKDSNILQDKQPDLTGRKAKCPECSRLTDSKTSLAFFEHRPEQEYDLYYCGCYGWD